MKHKCEKCDKVFDEKYAYDNHVNRKTPCDLTITPDPNAKYTCEHCGRSFKTVYTLNKHHTRCKMIKSKNSLVRQAERVEKIQSVNNSTNGMINSVIAGDNNSTTNTNVGNTTNITNININMPNITIYEKEHINELIHYVINDEKIKISLEELKVQIKGYLRRNKPHKIVSSILKFLHDNHLIPQGKNIFKGKGEYKDLFITKQLNGWAKTYVVRVIKTTMFALIRILALVNIDEKNEKTKKCIERLNDDENFDGDFYETINESIKEFEHSKKNPKVEVSEIEAKAEPKKIIIPKEIKDLFPTPEVSEEREDEESGEEISISESYEEESDELAIPDDD